MSSSPATPPFHVAIIGCGVTGLLLAIGLRARGVPFTVYERAVGISEFGAGIGLSPNAEVAMKLLDPAIHAAFKEAVTPNGLDYFQWIDGYTTNEQIFQLYLGKDGFQGGRRSEILGAWAALVNPVSVQFGKELVALVDSSPDQPVPEPEPEPDAEPGPVRLHFADGTTAAADVVIGADGVWSKTRSLLFGDAYRATYSHHYCFRAVVPMADAVAAIGQERSSTRFMYNGPGAHAITYPVAKGAMLNVLVVISDPDPWRPDVTGNAVAGIDASPKSTITNTEATAPSLLPSQDTAVANRQTTGRGRREDAEKAFGGWCLGAQGIVSLLPKQPDRWAIFDMLEHPVPSYSRGRVALAGDAAHASGPHLGAGAAFGIEDALALATVLDAVHKNSSTSSTGRNPKISAALDAYNRLRYNHTQWLIKASREAVDLFHWKDPARGQGWPGFGDAITRRFHTIWNYDLEKMQEEVLFLYEAALTGASK
ncbi:hypothetical protein SCUCBS95973_005695 [Sporothrix curviconia]|uniref:FAD-binding domain-containing protein n=1 Tax=Sporothrix curviconia TaxID=1260050 RepID=A0ABP0BZE9_9PEZI